MAGHANRSTPAARGPRSVTDSNTESIQAEAAVEEAHEQSQRIRRLRALINAIADLVSAIRTTDPEGEAVQADALALAACADRDGREALTKAEHDEDVAELSARLQHLDC